MKHYRILKNQHGTHRAFYQKHWWSFWQRIPTEFPWGLNDARAAIADHKITVDRNKSETIWREVKF